MLCRVVVGKKRIARFGSWWLDLAWRVCVYLSVMSSDRWEERGLPGLGLVSFGRACSCLA